MSKVKIALVGVGGISQVVRIPSLKKNDEVELVALCDVDEAKVSFIADKYNIRKVYFDIQNLRVIYYKDPDEMKEKLKTRFQSLLDVRL